MTTPSTERKAGPLLGTGAQTTWPFTFKVFAATDIAVTIADSLGVETALVYGVDYSVTLNANQETSPGGTVTYPISGSPMPVGKRLVIFGNLPYDQPLDLPSGGNFSPLALENQLDRLTMQIQQLRENLARALQLPVTADGTLSVQLPQPEPNELIGWDSGGNNLANIPLSDIGTAIAFGTYRYDTFTGDGTTTNFALSEDPAVLANLDVSISGVVQVPGTDYSLVTGNLVFASAPSNGTTILARYGQALTALPDSDQITFVQAGSGAVTRTVQNKLRDVKSISDYGSLAQALAALAGAEGTGYATAPVTLDLHGQTVSFTGTLFVPINVSLVNGNVASVSGSLVWRNPYLANTGLRGYTEYWSYMNSHNENVEFNCITVINVYIGAEFKNCAFNGLVFVNSNTLWTEYNSFERCVFASNASVGGCIRFDGNIAGTSTFSTGTGAGTPDGSFGYNNFEPNCKIDSAAPEVGITVTDGGTLYNCHLGFQGYARGAGPSGAFLYIDSALHVSAVTLCNFEVHLESFGAAANIFSVSANSRLWYNTGTIQSASPEMVMAQDISADIRANSIDVIGAALQDSSGAVVFNGAGYLTKLVSHVARRQWIEPKFSAYASNGQTFNSNTATKIAMDGVEFNIGTFYDSTNSRFAPKVAGYYQVNARVDLNVTATVAAMWVAIYKNGALYKYGSAFVPTNDSAPVVSGLVAMNGDTDYVEIYAYVFDNGGSPSAVTGIPNSYFNATFAGY